MHSEPSSYYENGDTGSETSVSATRGKLLHVLMRDEKEKRRSNCKQGKTIDLLLLDLWSNKQTGQSNMYRYERTCTCMSL